MQTKYDYYRDAAERHLETCKELREYIKANFYGRNTPLTPFEEKKQKMILSNIYYLSGYVIECIINYGILKHIRFELKNKKVKYLTSLDNRNGVSYHYKDHCNYSIYNINHSLIGGRNNKLHYFKHEVKLQSKEMDQIPFLNAKPNHSPNQDKLLKGWGANVRYEANNNLLTTSDIFGFQTNSEKIFTGLTNYILPKL